MKWVFVFWSVWFLGTGSVFGQQALDTLAPPTEQILPPPPPPPPEVCFSGIIEEMPRFPGCEDLSDPSERKECAQDKLLDFIYDRLEWPADTTPGKMLAVVSFIISKEGEVTDPQIRRSGGAELDEAVLAIVAEMPRWIPGKQRGRLVPVQYNIPIKLRMEQKDD